LFAKTCNAHTMCGLMESKISENLKRIRDNIAETCLRVGRDPQGVRLIAVTKMVEADSIRTLLEEGQVDLGESRPQELIKRSAIVSESISRRFKLSGLAPSSQSVKMPRWHMIGHLQRNKVRKLLPIVDCIHSVDSLRLAEEINTAAAKLGLENKVKILLQINTSRENQKQGIAVGALNALAEQIQTLPNLKFIGLMTMAPMTNNMDTCRFCFELLGDLFKELKGEKMVGPEFRHLSMGMSNDYIPAIEQGATMIRIGSALFE